MPSAAPAQAAPTAATDAVAPRSASSTDDARSAVAVRADALRLRRDWGADLYRDTRPASDRAVLTAIPYYLWSNRDPGSMLVWIPEAT